MSPRRKRAADWRAIAEVRALQSHAAELAAAQAAAARRGAWDASEEAGRSLEDAQTGWAAALDGAFDPALARYWFAHVAERQAEAQAADDALGEANERLSGRRRDWHCAELRSEVARKRRRSAAAEASRALEEARLGAIEDRAARKGRPA